MDHRPKVLCDMHLSDTQGDQPQTIRRSVSATLQIEAQSIKLMIQGTLVGVPGRGMVVEQVNKDDFALPDALARDLLLVAYRDMIGSEEPVACSSRTISGEIRLRDTCAEEQVTESLKDKNWH